MAKKEIMRWKRGYISVILGIMGMFLLVPGRALASEAYFTPMEIKGHILRAIEECKDSIDIAVVDITSQDMANALMKAQERGVHVRIVVDRKHALRKGLLSNQGKNKEFVIKVLIQKGIMHNNFAIFDCKLLTAGSYCWNENVGKFSRDNAIFTGDTQLLVKYQREFDRLFHEGITPDVKKLVSVAEEKAKQIDEKPTVNISKGVAAGEGLVVSNYGVVITETSDGYINMNFEEFNTIFGVASDLTEEQKEALWNRCTGKRVKWRGKVNYMGWGLVTGWMLGVTHGDTGVEIKLNPDNKSHYSGVKYGDTVTYTGKLDSRVTRIFPYKLNDGDILNRENTTLPEPLNTSGLAANPYTMTVSQGPKKIFLVETFEDIDSIFGKGSNLSDAQKDAAWGKYKGKYVSWMGQIVYKNINVASGMRIGIMQKERGDVEVQVGAAKKNKVLKFQEDEMILYTGRLTERCGDKSPYILEDGDIITIK